ncbi:MAG: hypothetical protein IT160_07055 [Bryobacterales bacterium]|nr:hypothetical protein [Bryobacterales bacterium]
MKRTAKKPRAKNATKKTKKAFPVGQWVSVKRVRIRKKNGRRIVEVAR